MKNCQTIEPHLIVHDKAMISHNNKEGRDGDGFEAGPSHYSG
jgi:hypothetical protein